MCLWVEKMRSATTQVGVGKRIGSGKLCKQGKLQKYLKERGVGKDDLEEIHGNVHTDSVQGNKLLPQVTDIDHRPWDKAQPKFCLEGIRMRTRMEHGWRRNPAGLEGTGMGDGEDADDIGRKSFRVRREGSG